MSNYSSKYLKVLFGEDFLNYLSTLNVLLIGVGGIGCELLKALSPYKFKKIHILDLDKIEVSNLNRQFLFRNHHVGNSKAHVAKETVSNMFPHMDIQSHHANIFEPQYAINFFKDFQIVFMALDNAEARSYVNRVCMILDLPLLEAGTTGHKGQVSKRLMINVLNCNKAMLIKKGMSRCYSCDPKPKAKTYPVCTIRTFPEKPIHCIIWGKHLFDLLFGPQEKDNPLIDMIDSLKMTDNDNLQLARSVFNELFYNQIMKVKDIEPEKFKFLVPLKLEENDMSDITEFSSKKILSQTEDIKASIATFIYGFKILRETKEKDGPIVFDKDDLVAMKFVSAISNIRAHVFNIPAQSEFTIKEMAGNIVPTIASTNAIVAAIQVTEAIKFLQNKFLAEKNQEDSHIKNKELYVQNTRTGKIIEASLGKENPQCLVCNENFLPHLVFTNFGNTLKDFVTYLSEKNPNLKEYRITNSKGGEIYETSEDIDEDEEEKERNENNATKTLAHWFGDFQGEIVLNDDTSGNVDKYLLSNDQSLPLKVIIKNETFNFKERVQNKDMITKMLDNKAMEIAVNKVKAYSKAKETEDAMAVEVTGARKGSLSKDANHQNNGGMILLEDDADDDDAIMFVESTEKKTDKVEDLSGKRKFEDIENGNEDEVGPGKKVK